ncbi:MAG TPA: nitroreductase family deazaflavin-dependent oxidoreductase [Caldilineae bacterium]|nr:nitroreductase family deazaflavin-dependent oxidoreductase [Caldilineae bacterium]
MTKTYELTFVRRLVNSVMRRLVAWDKAPAHMYLLTIPGRKSGELYSTPVTLVEEDGERWLVAPYGAVSWVLNARAAGEVTLSRGGKSETLAIEELGPEQAAPVLRSYLQDVSIVQPYFDCQPDSPLEDFEAEASLHPVFRLIRS